MQKENIDYMHFVSPYATTSRIKRMVWELCWVLLARPFPKSTLMPWKRFLLRMFGRKLQVRQMCMLLQKSFMPWNLEMKDYACIASGVDCYNAAPIIIGINATVSQRAYLCTASHNISSPRHEQIEKPIIIEDRAWVAAEAFIGPGIIIGEGAVVGARAAVFKDVEPWMVVGGNPAMYIKTRKITDNT